MRNQVDLCICVYRKSVMEQQSLGALILNGKRQVQAFVDCSGILEPGSYMIFSMAFNHWAQGMFCLMYVCVCVCGKSADKRCTAGLQSTVAQRPRNAPHDCCAMPHMTAVQ